MDSSSAFIGSRCDVDLPKRKRNRLQNFDYSSNGAYFVTICTERRRKTLCEIVGDGFPVLKEAGVIAELLIQRIPEQYPSVCVDKFVVMPNHIHLLLQITGDNGTGKPSPTDHKNNRVEPSDNGVDFTRFLLRYSFPFQRRPE